MKSSNAALAIAVATTLPTLGTGLAGRVATANSFADLVFFFLGIALICRAIEETGDNK